MKNNNNDNINLVWRHYNCVAPHKMYYKLKKMSHVGLTNYIHTFS